MRGGRGYPSGLTTPNDRRRELLRDADLAMYTAKSAQPGTFAVYDPQMHAEAMRRLEQKADDRSPARSSSARRRAARRAQRPACERRRSVAGRSAGLADQDPTVEVVLAFERLQLRLDAPLLGIAVVR